MKEPNLCNKRHENYKVTNMTIMHNSLLARMLLALDDTPKRAKKRKAAINFICEYKT